MNIYYIINFSQGTALINLNEVVSINKFDRRLVVEYKTVEVSQYIFDTAELCIECFNNIVIAISKGNKVVCENPEEYK